MKEETVYLIAGLPNSGTSALAGALYYSGLRMEFEEDALELDKPRAAERSKNEGSGSYYLFEIGQIMKANEEMLRGSVLAQGNLVNPHCGTMMNPPHPDGIQPSFQTTLFIKSIAELVPGAPFAIKDPRFTFVGHIWKAVIEATTDFKVRLIYSVRSPLAGANSMYKRRWVPSMEAGLDLWIRYNTIVEQQSRNDCADVVIYEGKETFMSQMAALTGRLGLAFDADKVIEHVQFSNEPAIDSKPLDEHPLQEAMQGLYDRLRMRAGI